MDKNIKFGVALGTILAVLTGQFVQVYAEMSMIDEDVTSTNVNSPTVNDTRNGFVTVNWTAPMPVKGIVYYDTQPLMMEEGENSVTVSGTPIAFDNYGMTQNIQIPVQQGMTYYYSIYTTDEGGNVNMTWPAMFKPWQ